MTTVVELRLVDDNGCNTPAVEILSLSYDPHTGQMLETRVGLLTPSLPQCRVAFTGYNTLKLVRSVDPYGTTPPIGASRSVMP